MTEHRLVQAIVLVDDLEAARRRAEATGLAVAEGGRHPGRGTANLVVPFGAQYLELLAIVDHREAAGSPQGRPVVDALASRGLGLARWSVETGDVDADGRRVGLPVESRHRVRPDGAVVRWRAVGVDEAWAEPWRCAFMAWEERALHPAVATASHPNGATGFAALEVGVPDEGSLRAWLGGPVPGQVTFHGGEPTGPRRLSLDTPEGPLPVGELL